MMSHDVPAVFDSGVFRPLEPVDLAEDTQVVVHLPPASDTDSVVANARQAWMAYIRRMEELSDISPADSFSNRDHDRIIYGI